LSARPGIGHPSRTVKETTIIMTSARVLGKPIVIGGVDSHAQTHQGAVIDMNGKPLGQCCFPATQAGYKQLLAWMAGFGTIQKIGVESTGSYAAGLTRYLARQQVQVIEVNRPHAHLRHRIGKTDQIDAVAAALKTLSGRAACQPKDTTGDVEAIRLIHLARQSAVKAKTAATVQLKSILVTAPAPLREQISQTGGKTLIKHCASLNPGPEAPTGPTQAAKLALAGIGARIQNLDAEINSYDKQLARLVAKTAPTLLACFGVGPNTAAQLLITAGANIDRLGSEASFARLCGTAPIPVCSGKTHRMRLHRGGDRQANRALHMITVVRMRYHQPTINYVTRRTTQGLSKKDIQRCLKRYLARNLYHAIKTDLKLT
jgi:transposase